jgi:hypothetical protein
MKYFINIFSSFNYYFLIFIKIYCGPWGLGIGDWGLGIGDWAQSPIPNPHMSKKNYYFIID